MTIKVKSKITELAPETETIINAIVERIRKIGVKNNDDFSYRITIRKVGKGLEYGFEAEETEDNHTFTSGYGETIQEAVHDANEFISEACKNWGYKE